MYNEKIREYYRTFYGKTFYNMSYVTERIDYKNMKGVTAIWGYDKHKQFFYVYKLEWGSGLEAKNYYGCTGQKPHLRLKEHCSVRGLDESRVKMTIIKSFHDREDAEMEEQWYIDQYRNMLGNENKN